MNPRDTPSQKKKVLVKRSDAQDKFSNYAVPLTLFPITATWLTNIVIMPATLRRRPCCPAKTGVWKGARNRTFRAGHRPWTGGWPGTPWNSPGKQLTARASGVWSRHNHYIRPFTQLSENRKKQPSDLTNKSY